MQVLLSYPMQSLLHYPLQNITYRPYYNPPYSVCGSNFCNFCKNHECSFKKRKTFADYINESVEKSLRLTFEVEKEERKRTVQKLILNEYSYIGKNPDYNSVTNANRKVPKIYYFFYLGIGSLIFIVKFYCKL